MSRRRSDKRDGVGPHGTRPDAGLDLKAVRTGIGAALRTLHSDVLRDEIPDRVAELLRQLDQQKDADDVFYEDGSRRSILGGPNSDAATRAVIKEQDRLRLIAEKSGNPVLVVKSIRRSGAR